ncbi:MAG: DUF4861 family protein [Bacteroidota bacterium]
MRKSKLFLLMLVGHLAWSNGVLAQVKNELSITLKNPRKVSANLQETVEISWDEVKKRFPAVTANDFKVINLKTGEEVPFQLEYKGSSTPKHLLLNVVVSAGKSLNLKIVKGKPVPAVTKVYGRYVPERKDDFAWENDRIAFRMYGKALESTNENAYGIDIWAKRTDKLVIDKWYKTGDYHADHGDGLDYYSVGLTLGGGDIAPYIADEIRFPKNYANWQILDKGSIRFTFVLSYNEWNVAGKQVTVKKQYTLDAGSQMNRVEATFGFDGTKGTLPVAIGIVQRKEPGKVFQKDKSGITGYWEPEHGADGTLGVGTIVVDSRARIVTNASHLLTVVEAEPNKPVVYYNGAAWNKAGIITDSIQWFNYLQNYKQTITEPLRVEFK